jgi:hypothetical protein
MQNYFLSNGTSYEAVPRHNPDCEAIFKGDGPAITSPQMAMNTLSINKVLSHCDYQLQQILMFLKYIGTSTTSFTSRLQPMKSCFLCRLKVP